MRIIAAADGSALGNPGPAGWAWYVDDDCWASGGWPHGTNNMGELTAVLDLLEQTADSGADLLVHCDSTYAIKTIRDWMPGWKRRGWRKGDGKPVANLEIVKRLDAAMRPGVEFKWVKGHAGHALNEKADELANAAARAFQAGRAPDAGPGFGGRGSAEHAFEVTRAVEEPDLFSLDPGDLPEPRTEGAPVARSDVDAVVALERSLLADDVRADPAAVARLLHPDWAEIGRSGRLWSRAEILSEVGPLPQPVDVEVISADLVAEGTLLLVWRAAGSATLRSSLWLRGPDGWQQRFHQGTPEP